MSRFFAVSSPGPFLLLTCARRAFVLALLLAAFASAQTTVTIVHPSPQGTFQGSIAAVDVKLERNGGGPAFKAFDLLITYDAAALTLEAVTSQMVSGCGWQYFNYQIGAIDSNSSGAVRIVAVADLDSVAGAPSCYLGPALGTLFTLHFRVSLGELFNCSTPQVQFYWNECTDNSFTTLAGDSLYLAQDVYPWDFMMPVYPMPSTLQTITGAPNSCLAAPIGSLQPARGIDFHQGYVSVVCVDPPLDWRGDINGNSIAYEMADAELFANYFFDGLSVFSPDPLLRNYQIAVSDVNANGVVLEFRDLVYLARVASGNTLPIPKQQPADTLTAVFTQNTVSKSVHVDSPRQIAGAMLHFNGLVAPTIDPDAPGNFLIMVDTSFGGTNVLLLSGQPDPVQVSTWLTYTGTGTLNAIAAVDFFDSSFATQIIIESLPGICGDVNHDNRINISDAVTLIAYIFSIWPGPFDPLAADVNCSGSISVSDAVYLVQYIFAGGAAPCASCPR